MRPPGPGSVSEIRLVNGSTGDPALFVDYPGKDDALLFDAGENPSLDAKRLGDLEAVFLTHHHVDHFVGFDRIVRANLDRDKTLRVIGPAGTIRKVYDRIKSYEYQYFPFQKITLEVVEIEGARRRSALLECSRRFPEPEIEETAWDGPVVHENADLFVEALPVDHTVPCLAYALVEKPGIHPDRARIAAGPLKIGPWVGRALAMLRAGEPMETPVEVGGLSIALGALAEGYFRQSGGARVSYITDTAASEAVRPSLLRLAHRSTRLYCDSFYANRERKSAEKHRHMTATQAAELARDAEVDELVLIHFAARYAGSYQMLVDEAREIFPRTSAEFEASLKSRG